MKKTESKKLVQTLLLALVATWGVAEARAATTFTIGDGGLETFNFTWDGTTESGLAGDIALTHDHVSGSLPSTISVCTDIGATVYLGQNYTYSAPTVFNGQDRISPAWGVGNQSLDRAATWTSLTSAEQANANAPIKYAGFLLAPTPETQYGLKTQEMLYNITLVPGPTTMIAGALLLLPFAASTVRFARKNRAA